MIRTQTLIYDKLCGTPVQNMSSMGREGVVLSPTLGTLFILGSGQGIIEMWDHLVSHTDYSSH